MKLTKTAVAVAVASMIAVPMAASATTTLSGVVEVRISGTDDDTEVTLRGDDKVEKGDVQVASGDVNAAISASQALNSGLTGYGSLRLDLDSLSNQLSDETDPNSSIVNATNDSIYVGVKGGFGDVRIGEVGNPGEYGQVAGDLHDVSDALNEAISYTGTFGGATVGLAYSPVRDDDVLAVGGKFSVGGFAVGLGFMDRDEKAHMTAGVSFAYAGASIALAGTTLEDGFTKAATATTAASLEDETHMHAKVGYSISGVSLGLTYSRAEELDSDKIRFDASYGLGGGMTLSTRISSNSIGPADSADWRVQLAKNF